MAGEEGTLDLLEGLGRLSRDPPASRLQQAPAASHLTIFYSGTVNVFKDVPPEKAHAIMLLLGSSDERRNRNKDAGDVPSLEAPAANNDFPSISRSLSGIPTFLRPPFGAAATPPPSSPFHAPQLERKPLQFISKRTQAELPFARKASLARFLEKRKDRVQEKVEQPSEEGLPESASKKPKAFDD